MEAQELVVADEERFLGLQQVRLEKPLELQVGWSTPQLQAHVPLLPLQQELAGVVLCNLFQA